MQKERTVGRHSVANTSDISRRKMPKTINKNVTVRILEGKKQLIKK